MSLPSKRRRLRMAAIDFLNPAPLMWDFEHEPGLTRLGAHYEITYTTPARCAAQLASGEADLGLVPVAGFATTPALKIVPGCAIASLERVRSILLVVRAQQGLAAVHTVAADTSSLTSFAYCRILFQKFWKVPAEFTAREPRLDVMLAAADAALLIGDPALLALEDAREREQRTGEPLIYLDLAQEWHRFTGLPWVSAFWAVRPEALSEAGMSAADVVTDLQRSRDHGLDQVEALVSEWSPRIKVPAETIRSYLTTNIYYHLDDRCLHGLREFYRLAAECGVLPAVPSIPML